MKDYCVMCYAKLKADDTQKYYTKYGNFCIKCTANINLITLARPDDGFILPIYEYQKLTKRKKEWYRGKLQKYWKSKKVYDRLSKKYQDSLKDVK